MTYSHLPDPTIDTQFYDNVLVKRLLAGIFDFCIVVLLVLTTVILTIGFGLLILIPLTFIVSFAYRSFFIAKFSGTLGMVIVGIELRNRDGHKFGTDEAMMHTATFLGLAFIPPLFLLHLICMSVTSRGQGLHDMLFGSTAINRPM